MASVPLAAPVAPAPVPPAPNIAHIVLSSVELLEAILLRLPTKDLLLASQVCVHFKNVISGSISIQRALFFMPGEATEHFEGQPRIQMSAHMSQLLPFNHVPQTAYDNGIVFNPLLVKYVHKPSLLHPDRYQEVASQLYSDLLSAPAYSSCRRMLVTQPPIQIQTVKMEYVRENRAYRVTTTEYGQGMIRFFFTRLAQDVIGRMLPPDQWEIARGFKKWWFCLSGARV